MKGIYLLVLNIERNIDVGIGALGKIHFSSGKYIYVGSAQNGIEQRVDRHKSSNKKLFWHIDYLLNDSSVKIDNVIKKKGRKDLECRTAEKLLEGGESIEDFGCSDCNCETHLIKVPSKFTSEEISSVLPPSS